MKVLLPNVNVSTLLSSHFVDLSSTAEVLQENSENASLIDNIEQSLNVDGLITSDDVDEYLQRLASEIPGENSAAVEGLQEALREKDSQDTESGKRCMNGKRSIDGKSCTDGKRCTNALACIDTEQKERKTLLKEPLKIGRRQVPVKSAMCHNRLNVIRAHPPKTQRRTHFNQQENGNRGMLGRGSRIRISSNSVTVAKSPQQECNHRPKNAVSNSLPNVERVRLVENKSGTFGCNRNIMHGSNRHPIMGLNKHPRCSQKFSNQQIPLQHTENEYFIAVTFCRGCNARKEHLLSKPGMWPAAVCCYCGSPWHIILWKPFVCEDDDDVVYAGEVINSPKNSAQKSKRPVQYGPDGIKIEPMDSYDNIPSCRCCGGAHIQQIGQPFPQGYCPNYHGSFSGSNMM